jgi:hypothetical protein
MSNNNNPVYKEWYGSMDELAATVPGITKAQLRIAKKSGCPAMHPSGRIHYPKLVKWLSDNPDQITLPLNEDTTKQLKQRKLFAETLTAELDLAKSQNEVVDKQEMYDLVRQNHLAIFALLKGRLTQELMPKVLGLDVVRGNVICCNMFEEICKKLQDLETLIKDYENEPINKE